jgi:uncharacterized membrane protein YdjX (TVP38/TMEM64 family)
MTRLRHATVLRWWGRVRIAVLAVVVGGGFVTSAGSGSLSVAGVHDTAQSFGIDRAPAVFIAFTAALVLVACPLPVAAAAAGMLFSTVTGVVVTLVGAVSGAAGCFIVARYLAADAARSLVGDRLRGAVRLVEQRGIVAVACTRIAPLPFTLMSYAGGLTRMRLRVFCVGTAIGALPRVCAFVAIGGTLTNLSSPQAVIAAGVLVALFALGGVTLIRQGRTLQLHECADPTVIESLNPSRQGGG